MALTSILSLLLLCLSFLTSKTKSSLLAYYESLRALPRLPSTPTPLDHLRYQVYKIYFRYQVTGPGYVLEPIERFSFDVLVLVLMSAVVWCSIWASSYGMKSVDGESMMLEGHDVFEIDAWGANTSFYVRTMYQSTFALASVVGDGTVMMGGDWTGSLRIGDIYLCACASREKNWKLMACNLSNACVF